MDELLSAKSIEYRDRAREVAERVVRPAAAELDRTGEYGWEILEALKEAVRSVNPRLSQFEASCFDGHYVTGDVTSDYLNAIEMRREAARDLEEDDVGLSGE